MAECPAFLTSWSGEPRESPAASAGARSEPPQTWTRPPAAGGQQTATVLTKDEIMSGTLQYILNS